MHNFSEFTECPACYQANLSLENKTKLICKACLKQYPVLSNGLPILIPHAHTTLIQSYLTLKKELVMVEHLVEHAKLRANSAHHYEQISKLCSASLHNKKLLLSIADMLSLNFSVDDLFLYLYGKRPNKEQPRVLTDYLDFYNNFKYLRHDWAGLPECEESIAIVENNVSSLIKKHCENNELALVLGAGAGRYGYDLASLFKNTIAVDLSIVMGSLYQCVSKADTKFYVISPNNAQTNANQVVELIASKKYATGNPNNNFNYYIADATVLPFKNNSVSAVISIYFTDMVPFNELWKEVSRVLRPGGIFIHYGPLGYQFALNNMAEWYTVEGLKKYLMSLGVELHDESWITDWFWVSPMVKQSIENWSFLVKKTAD
jgi:carnosine N-methyltransferase